MPGKFEHSTAIDSTRDKRTTLYLSYYYIHILYKSTGFLCMYDLIIKILNVKDKIYITQEEIKTHTALMLFHELQNILHAVKFPIKKSVA